MQSRVNAHEFLLALKRASMASDKKALTNELENVKVSFRQNQCTIIGSDLEQWISVSLPSSGDVFEFIFENTKTIMKACKYFEGDLTVELNTDSTEVTLSNRGKTASQRCLKNELFPIVPTFMAADEYRTNPKKLLERYNKIKYAVAASSEANPMLTGVCFRKEFLAALDGYRLAVNKSDDLTVERDFIVPTKAMKNIDVFAGEDVTIGVDEDMKYVMFSDGEVQLISRLIDGVFHDFNKIIPDSCKEHYSVDVKEYVRELKYLNEFIQQHNAEPIRFDCGKLNVETNTGNFATDINVDGTADIVYGYNCKLMLDALNQFKNDPSITIKVNSQFAPLVLDNQSDDLALVLPFRLKEKLHKKIMEAKK